MKCPCPKCEVIIEIPEDEFSAGGRSDRCPECKQKYWVRSESSMLRAFKKQGRIYCFDCGHELGCEMHCMHCNSLYPDYTVVQSSKFVASNQQKPDFSFSLAQRPKPAAQSVPSKQGSKLQINKNWFVYPAIVVIMLVLAGGLTSFYQNYKADQEYSKNYISVLYGIKSGTDLSLGLIADMSSAWKKALETNGIAPRTNLKDLDRLSTVNSRISQAMERLGESPEKFTEARSKLIKLHRIYEEIYELNISSPSSFESFSASVDKVETKFFKSAEDLKTTMPEELREELKLSVAKYRGLDFFVKSD